MTHGMSLIKLTVSTLEVLVDLITKHGGKLLWLTGVLGTYWAVQKSVIAWRKIEEALITKAIALGMAEANGVKVMTAAKVVFVGAVKKATVAMKAFLLSLVTNPVGIITLSILSLGTAFYKAYQIIDETTGGIRRSLKRVQEAQREFARESTMEQMAIDRLFGKLDALTKGTSEYQKVKDEILSKYGQYLNGLSAEIQALDDVKGAYEAISTAAKQAARDRAIDTATTKATEAYVEVEVENLEKIREALQKTFDSREAARYFEQIKAAMQEGGTIPEDLQQLIDETFTTEHVLFMDKFTSHIYKTNPVQEAINAIRAGKTTLQREIDSVNELLANVGGRKNNVDPLGLESDMEVIDYVSPKGGNTSSIENQMIALKDRYAQRLITQEEYENKLDALELAHLEYRLKNEDMNEEKRVELRQKIADKKLEIAEKARRKEERVDAIIEAKSDPVLKEENAYRKRLEEAGLFGKKREDLTEKQLQALEILEREHEANKDKILKDARKKQTEEYMKGIDERIKNLQLGQSMEVMELQMAQSAELEGFSGSLFQRQELLKEHQRQELALSETHAGEMMALLGEIFGEIEGKEGDSGEMVLTEQQKNELKKRLAEVGLSLSKLKISREELDKKKQADFDVLGMNASKWEEFFNNLRQGKAGIEEIEFAVGALGNAWSAYTKLRAAQTQKELKQYEQKTKKEKAELDKQLDSGQISQEQYNARVSQLDADLDAKKEKLEKEQRERERTQAIFSTTVSTAVAVAKAWELGPILGPILAALAAAMGVVQIATIKAAQYATGKYPVIGEDDGRRYEANYVGNRIQTGVYDQPTLGLFSEKEPEMVVDGNTTRKLILNYPRVYRSIIDISRGRVPQFAGGRYPTDSSMISSGTFDVGDSDPAMNRLLEKNIEMMNRLMNMEFSIPMYGNNGLVKKIKKAQDYEQSTKTGRRV